MYCEDAASSSQLVAIVDKYIKDNVGQWHTRMSGLVFEALRCRDAGLSAAAGAGAPVSGARKGELAAGALRNRLKTIGPIIFT